MCSAPKPPKLLFKKAEYYCLNMDFLNRNIMKIQEEFVQGSKKLKKGMQDGKKLSKQTFSLTIRVCNKNTAQSS